MRIISIGGGEIGRLGTVVETGSIDKEIIRLSGKKSPHVLFIPTASIDNENYYIVFKDHFGRNLNCKTEVLYLLKEHPTKKEIEYKILNVPLV